jgi:hypothetical protein
MKKAVVAKNIGQTTLSRPFHAERSINFNCRNQPK